MFHNLPSLLYLNINFLNINSQTITEKAFGSVNANLKICSTQQEMKNYLLGLNKNNDCTDICFKKNIKFDIANNICINSCKDNNYKYECNNVCYNQCPEGTHVILNDINNKDNIFIEYEDGVAICLDRNPEGYYLDEDGFYKKCFENCKYCYGPGNKRNNNCKECKSNYILIDTTNCYEKCQYHHYYNEFDDYICTENENCTGKYNKLIYGKSQCLDECGNDNTYIYEYNNICYDNCPKGTVKSSKNNICYGEKNFYLSDIDNNEEIYQGIKTNILNEYNISKGEEMIFQGENNFFFQITTIEKELTSLEMKNNNTSKFTLIDLFECEKLLKEQYEINENISLIIMKYEKISNNAYERSLQYDVYEPYNKTKLDLSICDKNIEIYVPVTLSEKTKYLYNDLKDFGYDLFNLNDPFYNDICTPYQSPEGTDVLLFDRVNSYFYNNDTTCQSNCEFSDYLFESNFLKCECDIKNSEININNAKSFNAKSIYESFYNVLKYSNYKVLKCTKLAFSMNSFSFSNIGSTLSILYFIIYFLFLVVCFIKGIKLLKIEFSKISFKKNDMKQRSVDNKLNIDSNEKIVKSKDEKFNNKKQKQDIIEKRKNIQTIIPSNPPKKKNYIQILKYNNNSNLSKNIFLGSKKKIEFNKIKSIDKNKSKLVKQTSLDNYELNNSEYNIAKKFDKRNFIQIYCSLLKREHLFVFTFITTDDHNITYVKYSRFFFLLCTDMAMNVFFFADETMHKMFLDYGKYNFIQQVPQIIYSTAVSQLIEILICYLSLTDKYYYELKETKNISKNYIKLILKYMRIKLALFFVFTLLLFVFYWYLITCFCAVYQSTQIAFIKDSLSSFILGLLLPFLQYLIPSLLRLIAVRSKNNIECVYKLSNLIPLF